MSTPILPFAVWADGTNQNSIPANDNSLRHQVLSGLVISQSVTAQPASPTPGDIYIIAAVHTGAQWAGFTPLDLAIYAGGSWYAFAPTAGNVVNIAGVLYKFDAGAWVAFAAGLTNPMTAAGDLIAGAVGGVPSRLPIGTAGYVLTVVAGAPAWVAATVASRAPIVQSVVSAATVTPTFANDIVKVTAQAAALALANPTGTAIDGLGIVVRIKDNGTARALAYGTQYRGVGVTLPTTTVAGKTLYLGMIWNAEDSFMDIVAVGQQA